MALRRTAEGPACVLLVGLSGAGKSTVGPRLAERLGYSFVDLDDEVQRLAGETVADLFRTGGEPAFRRWESLATEGVQGREAVVVATGGGWMARDDVVRVWPGAIRVWLRVAPERAAARLADGGAERPLLAGDPVAGLERLLACRVDRYQQAEIAIDTDGLEPDEVARRIVARMGRTDT